MQITNFSFLFLFLPLALLLAFLTRKHLRAQNTALLALSLAFYACSGLRGLSVLLALSFAVWLLARLRGRGVGSGGAAAQRAPVPALRADGGPAGLSAGR